MNTTTPNHQSFQKLDHTTLPRVAAGRPAETVPFTKAFHIMVNYWEIKPTQYEARLQELVLLDIRDVSTFVPWAHLESDIYHSLKKFIKAAHTLNIKVRLYVMPELGINYPCSGIPKELIDNTANLSLDKSGRVIYNLTAPNIFALPSFYAPEVVKRFGSYIIKVAGILSELAAEHPNDLNCEVIIGNGLFNYYRSFGAKSADHGDYSAAHVMAFREFLDREYPSAAGEVFKRQAYETHNRHRFISHVERTLREKTEMIFSRKNGRVPILHIDLLNPESAPRQVYHSLLAEALDYKPSLLRFYNEIAEAGVRGESIFLNHSGVFRRFSDLDKSFLVLASLIHSGTVALSSEEVTKLSDSFRRKVGALLTTLRVGEYHRLKRLRFEVASKFAPHPACLAHLKRLATGVLTVASAGITTGDADAAFHERLVFMDPRHIMRQVDLLQAITAAQSGKVVAVPAPFDLVSNYMPEALGHYEQFKKGREPLRINIGLKYEVYEYQLGRVVFYDPELFWTADSVDSLKMDLFFKALMGLASISPVCTVNDPRLQVICHVSRQDQGDRLLFLVNPEAEAITAKLTFEQNVGLAPVPVPPAREADQWIVGRSFELQVPARGVLSLCLNETVSSGEFTSAAENDADRGVVWN